MTSAFSLEGKAALVTGGNGGLGLMIARGLREAGARVASGGRDARKNEAARLQLDAAYPLDVTSEESVESAVAMAVRDFGRLDILVNCAGIVEIGAALDVDRRRFESVMETHVTGSYLCARAAARAMIARGAGGKILNTGSMYSLFGSPIAGSYVTAKTALLGLTRTLAVDFARHGIQVNALLPGWYETDSTAPLFATPLGARIRSLTPSGRYGQAPDIAAAAVFLASPASNFITGVALPVDGGFSITAGLGVDDWAPFL
jgi:2-deoxy-D-gluconate 3-dehydrogenase